MGEGRVHGFHNKTRSCAIPRSFHEEIDKATVGASLNANTTDNLLTGGVGLVFQKEIIF
jgi:hypothetical protein